MIIPKKQKPVWQTMIKQHVTKIRQTFFWGMLIALLFVLTMQAQNARPAKITGKNWAVIVGIDHFENSRFRTTHAIESGKEIANILQSNFGYAADQVLELYDEQATAERILSTLESLIRQVRPEDTFFAYFAAPIAAGAYNESFLIPYDGTPDRPENALPLSKMLYLLQNIPAKNTLVVPDACVGTYYPRVIKKTQGEGSFNCVYYDDCYRKGLSNVALRKNFSQSFIEALSGSGERGGDVGFWQLYKTMQSRNKISLKNIVLGETFVFTIPKGNDANQWVESISSAHEPRDRMARMSEMVKLLQNSDPGDDKLWNRALPTLLDIAKDESDDIAVRTQAIKSLGQLNYTPALVDLGQLLNQNNENSLRIQLAVVYAMEKMKTPETLDYLRNALRHASPAVRKEAVRILGIYRDTASAPAILEMLAGENDADVLITALESLPQLSLSASQDLGGIEQLLQHPNEKVRQTAVSTLGEINARQSVEAVMTLLKKDPDATVRKFSAYALSKLVDNRSKPRVSEALLHSLKKDTDSQVRAAAAYSLGEMNATEAEKELIKTAKRDIDRSIRRSAIGALGKMRSEKAVDELIELLQDPAPDIRRASVKALGEIGDERATRPLLAALKDSDYYVRKAANEALEQLREKTKDSQASEADEIADLTEKLRDSSPEVRINAIEQLAAYNDERIAPSLMNALSDPDYSVRESAIRALTNFRDASSIALYLNALQDRDFLKRLGSVKILGAIGNEAYLADIKRLINDSNSAVRAEVVQVLGNFQTERVKFTLLKSLSDSDPTVQNFAAGALAKHILRLYAQAQPDQASGLLAKTRQILMKTFSEDAQWRRWFNVLALDHTDSALGVNVRLSEFPEKKSVYSRNNLIVEAETSAEKGVYFVVLNLSSDGSMTLLNQASTFYAPTRYLSTPVELFVPENESTAYDVFKVFVSSEPVDPYELENGLNPERYSRKQRPRPITSPFVGMIAGFDRFENAVDANQWGVAQQVILVEAAR